MISINTQKIKNLWHLAKAILFSIVYRFPAKSLKVIAVTGTDGKTTTSNFLYEILKHAHKKVALISTISAKIGGEELETGLHTTSPDAKDLQKLLARAVKAKCEYLVLEITSHGIDQHRVWGIKPLITIYTNITKEHLDYHKTYENYLETKAKLIPRSNTIVLNKHDLATQKLAKRVKNKKLVIYNYQEIQNKIPDEFKKRFPGSYNLENAAAAYAAAKLIAISDTDIYAALANMPELDGRFNILALTAPFKVVVDFAHTPNALKNVLLTGRGITKGHVIIVFGATGLRDTFKRPIMGEIAIKCADIAVVTADDTRTEDVKDICDQITTGCKKAGGKEGSDYYVIHNRKDAINFTLTELAKENDLVIIAGKGHEKSILHGTTEYPWSDKQVVLDILKSKNG